MSDNEPARTPLTPAVPTDNHPPVDAGAPSPRYRRLFSRHNLTQLAFFGANGLSTAIVYSVAVWTLIAVSPQTFALNVAVAYILGVVWNYLGARWIFKPGGDFRGHAPRYLAVVLGNLVVTALIAGVLNWAGAPKLISAYLPVAVIAVPTFLLMRGWVFKPRQTTD